MNLQTPPTLKDLENELAIYFAALGSVVGECFSQEAAERMLGLPAGRLGRSGSAEQIDIKSTRFGRLLPVWSLYGIEGVLSAGHSERHVDRNLEGVLDQFRDLLNLLNRRDAFFEERIELAQTFPYAVPMGGLEDLMNLTLARSALDFGGQLDAKDLAALANMNERSVRNAMAAGDLKTDERGLVENDEAHRWLSGRRSFKPTIKRVFPSDRLTPPDTLLAVEFPAFIERTLEWLWTPDEAEALNDGWMGKSGFSGWIVKAARNSAFSMERLQSFTHLPFSILPQDCDELAKLLRVDRLWFTHQVMFALYPEQMDMLINPASWIDKDAPPPSVEDGFLTVVLTQSMLTHGYIDIPMSAKSIFPDDCFGTRQEGDEGQKITIKYGSNVELTDIRQKSSKTLSPRKRFTQWLNTDLRAHPGDQVRIERTADREYLFSFVRVA